jgi:hypothetical protein
MMIRQSTQVAEEFDAKYACRGIANIACTICTEAINIHEKEKRGVVVAVGVVVVVVVMMEDSSVSKEAECRSRDAC